LTLYLPSIIRCTFQYLLLPTDRLANAVTVLTADALPDYSIDKQDYLNHTDCTDFDRSLWRWCGIVIINIYCRYMNANNLNTLDNEMNFKKNVIQKN